MRCRFSFLACMLLVLTLVCASCAFAESDDYPWGMNEASVIKKMGKKGEEDTLSSPGNLLLRYYNQHISKFDATLFYAFRNDALFARAYGIENDSDKADYTYLGEALDVKYGASKDDPAITLDALRLLGADVDEAALEAAVTMEVIIYKTWTPDKDTDIVLVCVQNGSSCFTALFYIQPSDAVQDKQYNFDGL